MTKQALADGAGGVALDWVAALPGCALLLDAAGRVLRTNAGGRLLLESHPAILRQQPVLALRRVEDRGRLESAMATLRQQPAGNATLCLVARDGAPVLALRLVRCGTEGLVLVTAQDLHSAPMLAGTLTAYLGLTPAQARATALLADGLSAPEIADMVGVKVETIRSHLKRSMARLGQRSQLHLVAMLNRLSSGL